MQIAHTAKNKPMAFHPAIELSRRKTVEHCTACHTLTCMEQRRMTRRPSIRVVAAVTLILWISAWINCSIACSSGNSATRSCCHHQQPKNSQSPSDRGHAGCLAHKLPATPPQFHSKLIPPFDFVAYLLSPSAIVGTECESGSSQFCRFTGRDFLPPPPVRLGPAIRSLAPPVI